ncbi:hypothetical protein A3K34_03505 [candidate division WWE3 bacterium RIFOXYC1_FULL_40_10]|uniref:Uncharacterized protein n=1 Tax=candidate division WWE3 bacterium RIFOXYA2_FULL_46_9 TaxID=1802636 RepID=A0A1F4VYP0_UNCKA|nr:MAG: hypothetical protein A3K58_03505 [candidate division WWE3 bacterium RIFOXYB1_FULL_40_22]OGC61915.1 MAG: hypothetical protein A3K37_03505 [candidate division WWE3 bacterium RIFOXYA1_FULL_40_11]OGC62282.1 MAG: hypothetical protein A2264_03265 [candidate division WWE3 bacterium RIFOXYA2_FULL_46_9]OGC66298.1 MAG: hypothetical protein A3K34_03505 [candidate division WWE3 bacterium RIFOXYC1_FULL_40_10]OGC67901.1 MAG: hypothetical protein A2450_01695 [candidate division WWE3 bacterium RIFOXYC2
METSKKLKILGYLVAVNGYVGLVYIVVLLAFAMTTFFTCSYVVGVDSALVFCIVDLIAVLILPRFGKYALTMATVVWSFVISIIQGIGLVKIFEQSFGATDSLMAITLILATILLIVARVMIVVTYGKNGNLR